MAKLQPRVQLTVHLIPVHICAAKLSQRKSALKTDATKTSWSPTQLGPPHCPRPSLFPSSALSVLFCDQLKPAPFSTSLLLPSALPTQQNTSSPTSLRKQNQSRVLSAFIHQTYTPCIFAPILSCSCYTRKRCHCSNVKLTPCLCYASHSLQHFWDPLSALCLQGFFYSFS